MDIETAKAPEAQATEPPRERVRGLTIDSAYSLDLDDAFWVVKTDTGYAVDISIADVSFSIPKGSALDLAAAEKVETLYFRNSNEPMIPRSLAENALSLLPKQERNTITIRLALDRDAEVTSASFHETTIKSLFKFSHRRVDEELINPSGSFHRMLSVIQELSTKLYEKRRAKGACAFYDIESKLYADEDGSIRKYDGDFFHAQMIVQEMMIVANEHAARLMGESNYPAIYRNHKTKTWTPERAALMDQINGALIHSEQLPALRAKMALWFDKAEYSSKVEGHFGLNVPAYTHFSSPIRRYADLINHRVIRAIIRKEPAPYTVEEIEAEAKRINAWKIKIDEERSAKFKEQSRAEDRLLMTDRSKYLKGLKPSDFSRVLKGAVRENVLTDATKEAVMARINTGALEPADVYQLVFKASEVFAELQSALFELFKHKPQYSIMALEMARMNDGQEYSFRVEEHEGHFYALVDVHYKTTPDAAWATNKKSAQSQAAIAWIKAFFRKELVPSETVGIQPKAKSKPEVAKTPPTANYVGWIMEWCQANKNQPPTFEYSGDGPSHMPSFKCVATLTTKRGSISAEATSTNKQSAKSMACQKIYEAMNK